MRESLGIPGNQALYAGLYADVQGRPTSDNTSANGRRARAAFAKNAAFVVLLGQQPTGTAPAPLAAGQRASLLATTRALLESSNTDVEVFATRMGTTPYTEWQWRSKELIDYLIAYDLLRGAGETPASLAASQARLQVFAGNLYRQATTPFMGFTFFGTIKNNHTLMTAAALGMAAVVLSEASSSDNTQQPATWAGAGLYHIDNVLWRDAQRQSDSTQVAGYAEGPYYCKYALLNCLPFFRALGNFLPDARQTYTFGTSTRSIQNPYFDPKYARLYDWLTAIMLPDGRLPALEDSYVDMAMPELALTGQARYVRPLALSGLTGSPMNSLTAQLRDATVDMRAAYLAAALPPAPASGPALTVLPGSGNLVFRSGSDSAATYLHLYGRGGLAQANAGGHSQGDAGSFLLYAHGQLLALDPGYLSYARRAEVGQATNHNLVLVDGAGPAIGTPGAASPAQSTLGYALQTPQLTYGEVQTAYQGASLGRKALFVRNAYFLLADDVRAAAPHTYTWQLHGAGLAGGPASTGTFADSLAQHEGTWQKSGASLLAHVTATGGAPTYTSATNVHETTYNTAENHTTLLVQQRGRAQTQFLAALYPYATGARRPRFRTTSGAATAALAGTGGAYIDVAFAQADTLLQADASGLLPQVVRADGQLNFYSADSTGQFAQLFMAQGTALYLDTTALVRATRRTTLSWQKSSPTRFEGSVSGATSLVLALASAPASVAGPGLASSRYDAARQQLHLSFGQATAFAVQLAAPAPLPVVLTAFTARRRAGGAVALAWQTASEQASRGFAVQRQRQPGAAFETLGFVPSQGRPQQPASYAFQDNAAPSALTYYRLQQLDADGAQTYSPMVAVAAAPTAATLLAWPQPAQRRLWVQFADPQAVVSLRLLDATGRVVSQTHFQQQTELDVRALGPGLYYLQAQDGAGQPLGSQKVLLVP
ncbi:heparinase II/III family protein [Hymenobacter sp. BRD128]|uniref:heparinase II/III domain-containing protein n=1 Tax=Hymenobacter sp. BRD128 TaxID=2675878 RepID=UPI0020B6E05C|nr:heparinase II/III family protein [Hymenobacter sp. BRD128]